MLFLKKPYIFFVALCLIGSFSNTFAMNRDAMYGSTEYKIREALKTGKLATQKPEKQKAQLVKCQMQLNQKKQEIETIIKESTRVVENIKSTNNKLIETQKIMLKEVATFKQTLADILLMIQDITKIRLQDFDCITTEKEKKLAKDITIELNNKVKKIKEKHISKLPEECYEILREHFIDFFDQ